MEIKNHFAEVIESSFIGWVSQSWQWNTFPAFGSLVGLSNNGRTLFGIVHQVQTGSMDPSRYPFAYQKTEEQLLAEQPQIFEFLKTTFSCVTIGYLEEKKLFHLLAPEPPKIHSFVGPVEKELCKKLFTHTHYLHLLFSLQTHVFNLDELLLALLRQQAQLQLLTHERLALFMQTYSLLTGNDYRRIKLFLQRVEPLLD